MNVHTLGPALRAPYPGYTPGSARAIAYQYGVTEAEARAAVAARDRPSVTERTGLTAAQITELWDCVRQPAHPLAEGTDSRNEYTTKDGVVLVGTRGLNVRKLEESFGMIAQEDIDLLQGRADASDVGAADQQALAAANAESYRAALASDGILVPLITSTGDVRYYNLTQDNFDEVVGAHRMRNFVERVGPYPRVISDALRVISKRALERKERARAQAAEARARALASIMGCHSPGCPYTTADEARFAAHARACRYRVRRPAAARSADPIARALAAPSKNSVASSKTAAAASSVGAAAPAAAASAPDGGGAHTCRHEGVRGEPCGAAFDTRATLFAHKRHAHPEPVAYRCLLDGCQGRTFRTRRAYESHQRLHIAAHSTDGPAKHTCRAARCTFHGADAAALMAHRAVGVHSNDTGALFDARGMEIPDDTTFARAALPPPAENARAYADLLERARRLYAAGGDVPHDPAGITEDAARHAFATAGPDAPLHTLLPHAAALRDTRTPGAVLRGLGIPCHAGSAVGMHAATSGAAYDRCVLIAIAQAELDAHAGVGAGEAFCESAGCAWRGDKVARRRHDAFHRTKKNTCASCMMCFDSAVACAVHEIEVHRYAGGWYRCGLCDRVSLSGKPRLCAFRTQSPEDMYDHTCTQHTMERPHKCATAGCGFASGARADLERHVAAGHVYHCPYPDCTKLWDWSKKKHGRCHTREMKEHWHAEHHWAPLLRCPEPDCYVWMESEGDLAAHAAASHADATRGRFECSRCASRLDTFSQVEHHHAACPERTADDIRTYARLQRLAQTRLDASLVGIIHARWLAHDKDEKALVALQDEEIRRMNLPAGVKPRYKPFPVPPWMKQYVHGALYMPEFVSARFRADVIDDPGRHPDIMIGVGVYASFKGFTYTWEARWRLAAADMDYCPTFMFCDLISQGRAVDGCEHLRVSAITGCHPRGILYVDETGELPSGASASIARVPMPVDREYIAARRALKDDFADPWSTALLFDAAVQQGLDATVRCGPELAMQIQVPLTHLVFATRAWKGLVRRCVEADDPDLVRVCRPARGESQTEFPMLDVAASYADVRFCLDWCERCADPVDGWLVNITGTPFGVRRKRKSKKKRKLAQELLAVPWEYLLMERYKREVGGGGLGGLHATAEKLGCIRLAELCRVDMKYAASDGGVAVVCVPLDTDGNKQATEFHSNLRSGHCESSRRGVCWSECPMPYHCSRKKELKHARQEAGRRARHKARTAPLTVSDAVDQAGPPQV